MKNLKNIIITVIAAVMTAMIPCCAYAAGTTAAEEKGNTFLYVGVAGIVLLILAIVYFNRNKKNDE